MVYGEDTLIMVEVFCWEDESSIARLENTVLNKYKSVLKTYEEKFYRYGAHLKINISWGRLDDITNYRPPIRSNYCSFITCQIIDKHDNIIESDDHDTYMDFAWPLSIYHNGGVYVYTEIDDDLFELMDACEDYFEYEETHKRPSSTTR